MAAFWLTHEFKVQYSNVNAAVTSYDTYGRDGKALQVILQYII